MRHVTSHVCFLICVCVGLLACSALDDPPQSAEFPPSLPLDVQYTSCTDAVECQAVELGCCDACNGGLAVAVRTDRIDEVVQRFAERCGDSTACTLIGCAEWRVSCNAGTCEIERGQL